jgi:thioester reductase-like protein
MQLLARAADHGLQTTSFRIGQICGSQDTGTWAVTDWVALMIRSSVELGCLPEAMGVMSWIAPEAVSGAILDVAFGEEQPERALNVVHPRPITWSTMIEAAADELVHQQITGDRLPVVTMSDWYTKLAEAAVDADEGQIKRIVSLWLLLSLSYLIEPSQPALKLLDFFRHQAQADVTVRAAGAIHGEASGLTALSLTKVQQASRTMRELEPLKGADVGRWVGYWKSKGLFNDQN